MTVPFTVIGGTVLSLLLAAAPAQLTVTVASPEELQLVRAYRHLIARYRNGDAEAVPAVIALPRNHLETILRLFFGVPDTPWTMPGEPPAMPGELRGSAMLHTDAALRIVGPDEENGDRRHHLKVAGRMLHASGSRDDPFVPRWYYAVSRSLRDRHLFGVAEDLLERGRIEVPGNPTILYESATVAETLARGYSVKVMETPSGVPSIEPDTARNLQRRAGLLNDAARWLREALERDDTMVIARLHLGRVETQRSREKEALSHLERVFGATPDGATAYLAALFIGAAHERMGRPDAAAASYRQAIERFPSGHAAYVALSEILQRSGKTDESRAVLHSLLDGKAGLTREPWWWYLADPPDVADERLADLRREVRP
jgi:tetratricopeptide (TPR) repeat protein